MIRAVCFAALSLLLLAFYQKPPVAEPVVSPLAIYSSEWNKPVYLQCNTSANSRYLSEPEKELIWILNMARKNPVLFASTVVAKYPTQMNAPYLKNVREYKSLLDTMSRLKPMQVLAPDSLCWISAQCHAMESGKNGYVGHKRQTEDCKKSSNYSGECCEYSNSKPLQVLMNLLIDEGVPSLGHRYICLSNYYNKIGVSVQPHTVYGKNAVLDFY